MEYIQAILFGHLSSIFIVLPTNKITRSLVALSSQAYV